MEGGWLQGESSPSLPRDAGGPHYPLIRHPRPDAVFAVRHGRPITAEQFLRDVAALGRELQPRPHVLNLCADRYRFAVGLAAALGRKQVTLLPPNDAALTIEALAADYPDLYCLTDDAPPAVSIPTTLYPAELDSDAEPIPPTLSGAQPAVLLFTSGSTGRPKAAPKSWGTLVRSALAAGARLGAAALAEATVVGTVPHQHSYGLESTVLLALQHGLILQAERPFYPGDVAAALESAPRRRILVTTPIHIGALLAESGTLPRVDLLISATAPLARAVAVQAEQRFAAPLLEIYGCSEAGQIATRRTAQQSLWHCLEDISLRQDDQGTWAAGEPLETETLLHDVIELDGPTRFRLHGRTADLVNIAGKRSSLAHLDRQLTLIAGVRDGAFLMPEAGGERVTRLMAFVVAPGIAPEVILAALRERVDPAFLPRRLVFVDALPRNNLGKLPRAALLHLAARSGSA
jgi:acyl-coenzyme A synthetase/AMP-(fatty) acid ligase